MNYRDIELLQSAIGDLGDSFQKRRALENAIKKEQSQEDYQHQLLGFHKADSEDARANRAAQLEVQKSSADRAAEHERRMEDLQTQGNEAKARAEGQKTEKENQAAAVKFAENFTGFLAKNISDGVMAPDKANAAWRQFASALPPEQAKYLTGTPYADPDANFFSKEQPPDTERMVDPASGAITIRRGKQLVHAGFDPVISASKKQEGEDLALKLSNERSAATAIQKRVAALNALRAGGATHAGNGPNYIAKSPHFWNDAEPIDDLIAKEQAKLGPSGASAVLPPSGFAPAAAPSGLEGSAPAPEADAPAPTPAPAPSTPLPAAPAAPTAAGQPARPQSAADLQGLPSGSRYINPRDGRVYIKK